MLDRMLHHEKSGLLKGKRICSNETKHRAFELSKLHLLLDTNVGIIGMASPLGWLF